MSTDQREIEIRVVETDGLSYAVDALVLKHAQALYGFDALVVECANVAPDQLPLPNGFRVVRDPVGIGARVLLFIGVRPISEFSYTDIRKFGYTALCSVASAVPDATEIALTLHGVGYGLDEVECLNAEVAGIIDAIESQDVPRALSTVTFLEINPGRAIRLRERLASLLGARSTVVTGIAPASKLGAEQVETLRAAGSENLRRHAFVAMPFSDEFSDVFHYGISNAVRASGLLCERIDRQAFTGDVLERLKTEIRNASVVVADLTGANANVFLEVGFAWGSDVPTVFVCREGAPLTFDVQGQRCLFYDSIRDLENKLGAELKALQRSTID
ncbi:MAG: hypothetical protein WAP35_00730 [Solirubrobacterales bacterium]